MKTKMQQPPQRWQRPSAPEDKLRTNEIVPRQTAKPHAGITIAPSRAGHCHGATASLAPHQDGANMASPGDDDMAAMVALPECVERPPCEVGALIEELAVGMLEALVREEPPSLLVPRRSVINTALFHDDDGMPVLRTGGLCVEKRLTLAGARSFARIWKLLDAVHALVSCNKTATQRELYYMGSSFFLSQAECNEGILDVAGLLRVPRHCLGVTSTVKGNFCGRCVPRGFVDGDDDELALTLISPLTPGARGPIVLHSLQYRFLPPPHAGLPAPSGTPCSSWTVASATAATTISNEFVALPIRFSSDARFVLVIEKDGVFQRLLEDGFADAARCIMVTGKGFPDLATRAFVKKLQVCPRNVQRFPPHTHCTHTHALHARTLMHFLPQTALGVPVYGLADYNPYGLALLLTYKVGSARMGFEASKYAADVKWLGLRCATAAVCRRGVCHVGRRPACLRSPHHDVHLGTLTLRSFSCPPQRWCH